MEGRMAEHQRDKEKIIDLEKQLHAKQVQLDLLLMQNYDLHQAFTQEIQNMKSSARDHMRRIFNDQEKLKSELETRMRGLEARRQELMKREISSDLEQNCSVQAAAEELRKADEKVMKLAEEQKREKEALIEKLNNLEKELEAKQALELEIVELRGKVNVLKHLREEGDLDVVKKVELLLKEIREKEDAMNGVVAK